KNFLTVTTLSLGVPMIVMGDEVRRTQDGNNNAYCHDSELTWFDWGLVARHADLFRFVSLLNARRSQRDTVHEHQRGSLTQLGGSTEKAWHGVKLGQPDWGSASHSVAFFAKSRVMPVCIFVILNAYWEPLEFELPPVSDRGQDRWLRWIDTSLAS